METSESRSLSRLSCALEVSAHGTSSALGQLANISLDGAFVNTTDPLPLGAVVPLALTLPGHDGALRVDTEVVRHEPHGMGVRFIRMSRRDSRALRKHVLELTDTVGLREISTRLHDVSRRTSAAISSPKAVARLLKLTASDAEFTVIPETRSVRVVAKLKSHNAQTLVLTASAKKSTGKLNNGEPVLVLYTYDFVSYSFRSTVVTQESSGYTLAMPDSIHYSERRSSARSKGNEASYAAFVLEDGMERSWPVSEVGVNGFSISVPQEKNPFKAGSKLKRIKIFTKDSTITLPEAIVRHVTDSESPDHTFKVGIFHGLASETVNLSKSQQLRGLQRMLQAGKDIRDKAAYLYQAKLRGGVGKVAGPSTTKRVTFSNTLEQPVVGLLDISFPSSGRVRAPLVIVTPGFGLRKESMCGLAQTIMHNFRQAERDVAVLRIDGTNNLGESYKNPGCEADGKNTLQFTAHNGMHDLLGAIKWARENRHVDPTDVVVISVSYSSIGVRCALASSEAPEVSKWIAFMGAADAASAMMNASGHVDLWGNYVRGVKTGVTSMMGCLVDSDFTCKSLAEMKAGTLEDARRDLSRITADVTWIVGKVDAYFDPRRVSEIMSVKAKGKRAIVEVNSGHIPRSNDEALSQFVIITQQLWKHFYGTDASLSAPPRIVLAAANEHEWKQVKHQDMANPQAWWKAYLLPPDIGFDVRSVIEEYQGFVKDVVSLVDGRGQCVLDVGAGTGAIASALIASDGPPREITAIDLVPEALDILSKSLPGKVQTLATSVDGGPKIAFRRWLEGDLGSLDLLAERLPEAYRGALRQVERAADASLYAYLRGAPLALNSIEAAQTWDDAALQALKDLHALAQALRHFKAEKQLVKSLVLSDSEALLQPCGLPQASQSCDRVIASLLLNYLKQPEDFIFEAFRVLRPNGLFIAACMLPDADDSKAFLQAVSRFEAMEASNEAQAKKRTQLLKAARTYHDQSNEVSRYAEEGRFSFWPETTLQRMVMSAGFFIEKSVGSYGQPNQALILVARKVVM